MRKINCIIPTSGSASAIPLLKKSIKSVQKAADGIVKINFFVVSNNPAVTKVLQRMKIDNFLLNTKSGGFSEANNLAIQASIVKYPSEYYLFINDDAWIKSDFFEKFYDNATKVAYDVICPLIHDTTGKVQSFGIEYFPSGYAKNNTSMSIKSNLFPAACVLVKTVFLKKLNTKFGFYFNPILYSYYEDIELSIRAHAIGVRSIKLPDLKVFHVGSNSYGFHSKIVMHHTYRNILWVIWMTWPTKVILSNFVYILIVQLWFIFCSIRDNHLFIYPAIAMQTIRNYKELRRLRKKILNQYEKDFNIDILFSQNWFRLRRSGVGLKRLNVPLVTK